MPVALHLFVTMLAHLHSSVNFCVYITCNKNFRSAILRLLTCRTLDKLSFSTSDLKTGHSGQKISSITGSSNSAFATQTSKVVTPTTSNE
ncbi:melatonin receptor type 1b [Plakobranchus ocellatus]|uniref:Melatonin receptor type 1b n=1 Tax=Plakobranchus ocellatus TaxID=259542 RepID=A0AAV4BX67_9GAST|nr:melatonin receptor type 1b [Plakobranchus ocellatus]